MDGRTGGGGGHIISEVSVFSERDGIFGCGSRDFLFRRLSRGLAGRARARAPGVRSSWMRCGTRVTGTTGACRQKSGKSAPTTSPTSPSPTGAASAAPSPSRGKKGPGGSAPAFACARERRLSPVHVDGPRPRSETRDSETRDGEAAYSVEHGGSRPRWDAPRSGPREAASLTSSSVSRRNSARDISAAWNRGLGSPENRFDRADVGRANCA